jgi:mannan endo-1,4-beta-mannosidase
MMKKFVRKICCALCAGIFAVSAAVPLSGAAASQTVYEAEQGTLSSVKTISGSGYSGGKYVYFETSGSVTFKINVEQSGLYTFNFVSSGIGGDKVNSAYLDGAKIGQFTSSGDSLGDADISAIYVEKGSHTVKVSADWGWIRLDCLKITQTKQKDYYSVSKKLINSKASDSAQRLMSFIADNYGVNVISGQTCDNGINGNEFKAIKNYTGKTPAILGMDLMRYTPTRVSKGDSCKTVENAIEFSNAGGIVELCWHWNAPDKYLKSGTDSSGNPRWWGGFYTENVNMDFSAIMDGTDEEGYELLMADIDAIAVQLKKLADADVPVLFRPLHEASGGWFWWGSDGSEPYIKLWKVMYDKLTNEYGLNNLIWVWNGQDKSWYPGDEYVDIIGEDIYPGNRVYEAQSGKFDEAANYTSGAKVVALTENGCLFDVDKALNAGTVWSWFCVWSGDFCSNGTTLSESYTEKSMWKKVYNHENVLTLEDLPDLKSYPLNSTEKINVKKCVVSLSQTSYTYDGTEKKPSVTVKCRGKVLKSGTDYKVSYSSNVSAGTGKVTITGLGSYTGSRAESFTVSKGSISKATVGSISAKTYSGSAFKPSPTVKLNGVTLKKGTDYTLSYSNNTNAGTATVTITGKGNYSGKITKNFKINSASISKAKIGSISNKAYTGKAIKPTPSVKLGSKTLKKGTDYTISYKNNVKTGKATVTIKGKGNYSGTVTKTFKIVPKKATVSKVTSPKRSQIKVTWKKDSQATGYQIVYSTSSSFKSAKSVTVTKNSTTSKVISKLTAGKKYYVKVRSYKTIDGKKVYGAYSTVKTVTVKKK